MSFLTGAAAKAAGLLLGFITIDLRTPVQVVPSAAVLEARQHAAALSRQVRAPDAGCLERSAEAGERVAVVFLMHSADLLEDGRRALETAAAGLACAPDVQAFIVSEGDAHRLASYRLEIAERRFEVIAAQLLSHGVSDRRISRAAPPTDIPNAAQGVMLIEAAGRDR